MSLSVYLAGPINGQSYEEARYGWRAQVAAELRKHGIDALSPMRGKEGLSGADGIHDANMPKSDPNLQPKVFVARDINDLRRCDGVLVRTDGMLTGNTVWEMGFAFALNKPVVGVGSDNDAPLFVRQQVLWWFESPTEAARFMAGFLVGGV